MLDYVRRTLARPAVALWLTFDSHSWKRRVIARDSPHVSAPGESPDRVLLIGDGVASGRGVVTHDLGLPGFLARSLSKRTGHATEVDIVVDDDMTVMASMAALSSIDLEAYDIIVLSVGANESLTLLPPGEWLVAVRALIVSVRLKSRRDAKIFVLAAPQFGINPHFPRILANIVDYHVGILNTITEHLTDESTRVVFVPESHDQPLEEVGAPRYKLWADSIADRIARNLDPHRARRENTADAYEAERLRAFERLESLGTGDDPVLDELTAEARRHFGTDIAAVTFIGDQIELIRAASGVPRAVGAVYPRSDSLCNITIRRAARHVIEDLPRDPRYADSPLATGDLAIRFYAGYPIESPDGYRIGALCIMDSETRGFSDDDSAALRILALKVQQHLYREVTTSAS